MILDGAAADIGRSDNITISAPVGANKYTNIVTLVCTAVMGWLCQVIELGAVIPPTDQIASALVVVVTVTLQI